METVHRSQVLIEFRYLDVLKILLSLDNILPRKVSADLEHFSRYAVAY